jgi:5-methyltetrahydropteroyltriglutamate--homocysteine methyltransferase
VSVLSSCLGHPRIGVARELKRALEHFWKGTSSAGELLRTSSELRKRHLRSMRAAGIDHVPCNDFSLYDHVLDAAACFGAVPSRYRAIGDPLARYFAMARGLQDPAAGVDVPALEMTKWFDTNYHYIVPELAPHQRFELDATKLLAELDEARSLGIEPRPVIIGPVTFLLLSKLEPGAPSGATPLDNLPALLSAYEELFALLSRRGVAWVQLDEPCLVTDLSAEAKAAYRTALPRLTRLEERPKLLLTPYFGALADNLELALESGCEGLHLDLVRAPDELDRVLGALPSGRLLSLGVVDGRNVWRTDLDRAHALVRRAVKGIGEARVLVASSCSLLHVPIDLDAETSLDAEVKGWLAFATQKLGELRALAQAAPLVEPPDTPAFVEARAALRSREASPRTRSPAVRARVLSIGKAMRERKAPFPERERLQRARFALPPLPTTTIGSFPQTAEVRSARAAFRAGKLSAEAYQAFLREETARCVKKQEELGLDVLVHGEFERADMVEYFGEKLAGFLFTQNGWVQSYGSRCVKPPILFGDVARPRPMTVEWARYAQDLTRRPMKGMLTGPVTILQWSFVRDDLPRHKVCFQIALALRDEVLDLEAAGISMIQVDEPALREGLPLRKSEFSSYLDWAVDAFKVATSGVRNETQIHTHMCYSEFGDILPAVAALDADVLSIETSRSKLELLEDFARFRYPNQIGPGVYDIHSPRIPSAEEMLDLLRRAASVLPPEKLWVNPDCGLKTRGWPEVEAALENMVTAAERARSELATRAG